MLENEVTGPVEDDGVWRLQEVDRTRGRRGCSGEEVYVDGMGNDAIQHLCSSNIRNKVVETAYMK